MPETAESQTAAAKMCSKCGKHPRADSNGNNPWCKECRADYARIYAEGKAERMKDTGFSKGAEAMRIALIEAINRTHPNVITNYGEVARWIREYPIPTPRP